MSLTLTVTASDVDKLTDLEIGAHEINSDNNAGILDYSRPVCRMSTLNTKMRRRRDTINVLNVCEAGKRKWLNRQDGRCREKRDRER